MSNSEKDPNKPSKDELRERLKEFPVRRKATYTRKRKNDPQAPVDSPTPKT